jgi:hypothetical protein
MTQIISAVYRGLIFHVSDRLLTWDDQARRPADRRSNKCVIAWCRDAGTVIGYSGIAEIAGMPTDDWIAGALCSPVDGPWRPAHAPNDLGTLGINELVERVAEWIGRHRASLREPHRRRFGLAVQLPTIREGKVRDGKKRLEACAYEIRIDRTRPRADCGMHRDHSTTRRVPRILATPPINDAEMRELLADLANPRPSAEELEFVKHLAANRPDKVRRHLAELPIWIALRRGMNRAAERRPTVGDQFVEAMLTVSEDPPIRLDFNAGKRGHDVTAVKGGTIPLQYTPWIVTQFGVFAPSVSTMTEFGRENTPLHIVVGPPPAPTVVDGSGFVAGGLFMTQDRQYDISETPSTIPFPFEIRDEPPEADDASSSESGD